MSLHVATWYGASRFCAAACWAKVVPRSRTSGARSCPFWLVTALSSSWLESSGEALLILLSCFLRKGSSISPYLAQSGGRAMTLSWPSACAALTRASIPPRSAAEVAEAASLSLPDEPLSEPQAASVSAVASAATALIVVRMRTGLLRVGPALRGRCPIRRRRGLRILTGTKPCVCTPERDRPVTARRTFSDR